MEDFLQKIESTLWKSEIPSIIKERDNDEIMRKLFEIFLILRSKEIKFYFVYTEDTYFRKLLYELGWLVGYKVNHIVSSTEKVIFSCKDYTKFDSLRSIIKAHRRNPNILGEEDDSILCGCAHISDRLAKNFLGNNYNNDTAYYYCYNTPKIGVKFSKQ